MKKTLTYRDTSYVASNLPTAMNLQHHHHHHHHPMEFDSATNDSAASSPRSDHRFLSEDTHPRVRFMCSFGGNILPRPHDNQLRYVGGDTRMVAVHRHTTFLMLLHKLSKLTGTANISVKYQLPNEDLDALITVTTDEDVENMMEEYDRFAQTTAGGAHLNSARLRLFLFSDDAISRTSSISSLLDGSTKREHWFLDALNGGTGLERGRSEVSSIVSEVPDYLFGLETSDEHPRETKLKTRSNLVETVSNSDPGSPAPVVSSPFCSTSSSMGPPPPLPPVRTRPENPVHVVEPKEARVETFSETNEPPPPVMQQRGYAGNPMWHYVSDPHYPGQAMKHVPVYYMQGQVPAGNAQVQPAQVRAPCVQQFSASPDQVTVGFHQPVATMGQLYGGGMRPMVVRDPYAGSARVASEGWNPQMYYGAGNAYSGMVVPGGEELQGNGAGVNMGRVSLP